MLLDLDTGKPRGGTTWRVTTIGEIRKITHDYYRLGRFAGHATFSKRAVHWASLCRKGVRISEIATRYGVSRSFVANCVRRGEKAICAAEGRIPFPDDRTVYVRDER